MSIDMKYGLIAVDKEGNIHHFCGYEELPQQKDIDHLKKELATDPEFGLSDIISTLTIVEAPSTIVNYYNENFGN